MDLRIKYARGGKGVCLEQSLPDPGKGTHRNWSWIDQPVFLESRTVCSHELIKKGHHVCRDVSILSKNKIYIRKTFFCSSATKIYVFLCVKVKDVMGLGATSIFCFALSLCTQSLLCEDCRRRRSRSEGTEVIYFSQVIQNGTFYTSDRWIKYVIIAHSRRLD